MQCGWVLDALVLSEFDDDPVRTQPAVEHEVQCAAFHVSGMQQCIAAQVQKKLAQAQADEFPYLDAATRKLEFER